VNWRKVESVLLEFHGEDEGYLAEGKWYPIFEFVAFLQNYCRGGTIYCYSLEHDGAFSGWEFNRRGQVRELAVVPVTRWLARKRFSNFP
jgi:hypothetical protein